MPDKQYISYITLPNGQKYDIKDQEARDLISSIIAGGVQFKVSTNAATTPQGISWDDEGSTVLGTLVASGETKAFIYLVPHKKDVTTHKVDFYREYVTVNFGTEQDPSWAWEFLGDTDIDLSGLGALAWKNDATGSVTFTTADSATFSNGAVTASATYTPAGSVSVQLSQTGTAAELTKSDYTPAGSVSKPNITVTESSTKVQSKKTDGSVTAGQAASFTSGTFNGGSFTQGVDQFTAPTWTATVGTTEDPETHEQVSNETLVFAFTAGSFTRGVDSFTPASHGADTFTANTPTAVTLPTFEEKDVLDGATAALDAAPEFTGTKAAGLQVTGVNYDKAGVQSASFSGTKAENALVTGVTYDKAGVQSAGFTGSEATISSTGSATGDVTLTKTAKTETVTVS